VKADPIPDPVPLTERQAFLVLNALPEIGPIALNRLLADLGGDPRRVLEAAPDRLRQIPGIRPAAAAAVARWRGHFDLPAEESRLKRSGVDFIAAGDRGYPELLRRIHDPPIGLYRQGPYGGELPAIAIVGTRRATPYGRAVAGKLAADFVRAGYCIVSGLAQGIDTAAHEGALAASGRTVAVLGTGLDLTYPPENRLLRGRIAEAGAVYSEFPFGRPASRQSFPMRNRIVSGLADAVIVVESDAAGGAMITARLAGEQGKPLFAVPGRIDQATSAGCHQLLRDGASLLTRAEDVLEELSYLGGRRPLPIPPKAARPRRRAGDLPEDEARILGCLAGGEGRTLDGLALETGWPAARISAALLLLEIKRRASRRLDGAYEASP
jgi:DNA processing protein